MDGLLVDSERTTRGVWQAATAECGFELTDAIYLSLIGLGADEAERTLARRFGSGFDVPVFTRRRTERMRVSWRPAAYRSSRAPRRCSSGSRRPGLAAGLATSSSRDEVHDASEPSPIAS